MGKGVAIALLIIGIILAIIFSIPAALLLPPAIEGTLTVGATQLAFALLSIFIIGVILIIIGVYIMIKQ